MRGTAVLCPRAVYMPCHMRYHAQPHTECAAIAATLRAVQLSALCSDARAPTTRRIGGCRASPNAPPARPALSPSSRPARSRARCCFAQARGSNHELCAMLWCARVRRATDMAVCRYLSPSRHAPLIPPSQREGERLALRSSTAMSARPRLAKHVLFVLGEALLVCSHHLPRCT